MNICVFLSAYDQSGVFELVVRELGGRIAEDGHTLIFGASDVGLMKVLADSVIERSGKVVGVTIPAYRAHAHQGLTELVETTGLSERKQVLLERSDVFVVLPGGIGTLDEMAEILELKKQGVHDRPIIILNSAGFYDHLQSQFLEMERQGFLNKPLSEFLTFVDSVEGVVERIS